MLKILHGVQFGCDCDTGDIYLIDADGKATKLTDGLKLASIKFEKPTTTYTAGQMFDCDNVVAVYTDGSEALLADGSYTIEPAGELTVDDTSATATYTSNGVTCTVSVDITVTE